MQSVVLRPVTVESPESLLLEMQKHGPYSRPTKLKSILLEIFPGDSYAEV